jgi:hypothetical protein
LAVVGGATISSLPVQGDRVEAGLGAAASGSGAAQRVHGPLIGRGERTGLAGGGERRVLAVEGPRITMQITRSSIEAGSPVTWGEHITDAQYGAAPAPAS